MKECARCGGLGFIEEWYHYGSNSWPAIRQCCDIVAYSARAALILEKKKDVAQSLGEKTPFIYPHVTLTSRGIELRSGPSGKRNGEPCPVIPMRRP